ncbi:hypothetical protein T01_9347 [Trichinella spiralis]|uniref:Uncharacterized protein n=1 Tax=Trichinella spiralis TaxID=6334 RepID=A0A0V1C2M9_TRISP|nr:hypothetical protein T01_9347 [Trichinella spiralis]
MIRYVVSITLKNTFLNVPYSQIIVDYFIYQILDAHFSNELSIMHELLLIHLRKVEIQCKS